MYFPIIASQQQVLLGRYNIVICVEFEIDRMILLSDVAEMPARGQVDMIVGGPPCQVKIIIQTKCIDNL